MKFYFHQGDLPESVGMTGAVAVDTESMGLYPARDRLCLVQLSNGDGACHLVQIQPSDEATRLCALLSNRQILKIFHFARADMQALYVHFGCMPAPIYCTKIASRFVRTYAQQHSLKVLLKELLDVDLAKTCQCSDWGAKQLSQDQKLYAAYDVFYLHRLKMVLDGLLKRERRKDLAQSCFDFLPTRIFLDSLGYSTNEPFDY